jgi:hypothetical protein
MLHLLDYFNEKEMISFKKKKKKHSSSRLVCDIYSMLIMSN